MSKKILTAAYERSDYEKDVFTDAIIYSNTLAARTATKITNAALTTFGLAAGMASTATQLSFDTLVGNLPWSSYSKFAANTSAAPKVFNNLPVGSLPSSGAITITEGGVGTEVMYYGSVTWTTATTGTLNNIKRASTAYTFTGGATGTFTNVIPVREYITIWNRTGAILYLGDSSAIDTTTNSFQVASNGTYSVWLEPLQGLYAYSSGGGAINIAEYR